jgi:hypothetical protein
MRNVSAIVFSVLIGTLATAEGSFSIHCRPIVPKKFRNSSSDSPTGEQEASRYTRSYEAFWWNCVAVRAANMGGRCPFMASGTPAASAGASDGGNDAGSQIDGLLKKHSASAVQKYLGSISSIPSAKQKMHPYFNEPTPER